MELKPGYKLNEDRTARAVPLPDMPPSIEAARRKPSGLAALQPRPGYKLTDVGVVPEDWNVARLREIAGLQVGYAFKSDWFQKQSGIRLLRGENVGYGQLDWADTRTLGENLAAKYSEYRLQPGDVVIGMDRTFTKSGTKISVLRDADCPCLLVQRVGRFLPHNCDASYLRALLASEGVQAALRLGQKGMDIPHLSREEILSPIVALPPTPAEQWAIAGALSDVDALIGALDQLLAKKRDLKQAAMQQLLTGHQRLPGFAPANPRFQQTDVGTIPEDWESTTIGDMAAKVGSGITPTGGERVYKQTGRPFVRSQNVGWGRLLLGELAFIDDETHARFSDTEIQDRDVLLNITGASIGRSAVADSQITGGNVNQHVCIIRPRDGVLDPVYLNRLLLSDRGQRQIDSFQAGGNRQGLNFGQIRSLRLPRPSLAEQTAIAEVLSDMDAELAALEQKRDKTRLLKQGMMQELLTGRTRLV